MRSYKLAPLFGGRSIVARGGNKKKQQRKRRYDKEQRAKKNKEEREKSLKKLQELNKKAKKKHKYKKKKTPKEDMWGDDLNHDNNWPNLTENKTIRIFGHNTNGISYKNNYLEWMLTLQQLEEYQVDVACLVETNLDTNKPSVRRDLKEKMRNFDKFAKLTTSSSKESHTETAFKPGGTCVMARGNWAGRVTAMGQDELGRWSFITMEGRQGKKVTFIAFYRVCKKNSENGKTTIRIQQERDLFNARKSQKDPREVILVDLENEIRKKQNEGHEIIIFGDINDEVRDSTRVKEFLESCDLINVMTEKHPNHILPTTYDRGSKCLDLMGMSKSIDPRAIHKCGILPFYHGMPSDHRAFYLDVKAEFLFTNAYVDKGISNFKRFSTTQTKKCNIYLQTLEMYLEQNRIPSKVNELEKEMKMYLQTGEGNINDSIEKCKKLFEKQHNS